MLTVYRSNRAEWLARLLAEQLRLKPPALFENVEVVVNSWPTGRWLGEQIATTNGISALVKFPFPGSHLQSLVDNFLELDSKTANDPWEKNQLIWSIVSSLPELLRKQEAQILKSWLDESTTEESKLTRDEWQLAKTIACTFDEYIFYRPELIYSWWDSTESLKNQNDGIDKNNQWQRVLFGLLKEKISQKPFCLKVKDVVERLREGEKPPNGFPSELLFFGINSLAPIQIELIQAISTITEIKLFLLTPCKDLWTRCKNKREELGEKWRVPTSELWLLNKPRLEANLGRMGSEFEQLLEGSGEYQLGEWNEQDLFSMPVNIAKNKNIAPTLLEQLQQKLVTTEYSEPLSREQVDNSLIFIESPGQRRQVELVRDHIIQLLALDNELQPKDILIMTPQVETLAPLIPSIFNDINATDVYLPWKITDRTQEEKSGPVKLIFHLMGIASTGLKASDLDELLSNEVFKKRYKLTDKEIDKITSCLQKTGFRSGVNSTDRDGEGTHTLTWCLERWLMGIVIPSKPGLSLGEIAPFSEGIKIDELTKWWELLSKTCNQLVRLRRSRKHNEWGDTLKSIIDEFCNDLSYWSWEHQHLCTTIDKWLNDAKGCELEIGIEVVSDILKNLISLESGRFGHRTGKITISALEPMRAIPHKVIVLMGLDENVFPRQGRRPGFSMLEQKRLLGDPRINEKDRYVLLEAIISARRNLLITWNSRDEKTGESLEPSNPIQQWLEYLEGELPKESRLGILKKPNPNPLNKENFISCNHQPPVSCDKRNLAARKLIDEGCTSKNIGLAIPLKWDTEEDNGHNTVKDENLLSWLVNPQTIWLEQLRLQPREWNRPIEDLEGLNLSELDRYNIFKKHFLEVTSDAIDQTYVSANWKKAIDWSQIYKYQGIFPPKSSEILESEILTARWSSLSSVISGLGTISKTYLIEESKKEGMLKAGNHVVVIEFGRLKAKSVLEGWLKHLIRCTYNKNQNKTVVISRSLSSGKRNTYEIVLKWNPIQQEKAQQLLQELRVQAGNGLKQCWPVPPESGWKLAKARSENVSQPNDVFKKSWNGAMNLEGERNKPEMQICFGHNCNPDLLLEDESFEKCLRALYEPLINALEK